jgi:hypothetical protein
VHVYCNKSIRLIEKVLNIIKFILNFFPVKLVFIHFKRNILFLVFWLILFGLTSKNILPKYGIDYLFLTPEYLGEISFLSYAILGFSIGGFIMAFNIYSYILVAPRFLFIASLSRPFYKFCLNNFIIPIGYIIFYSILSIKNQQQQEFKTFAEAVFNVLGFYGGIFIFLSLSLFFFFRVNKIKLEEQPSKRGRKPVKTTFQNSNSKWYVRALLGSRERVDWYISSFTEIARARDVSHYTKDQLKQILYRNHLNATIFEIAIIVSLVVISIFGSAQVLFIPAAASLMLMLTFLLMVLSAVYSWIGGWTIPLTILLVLSFNTITERSEIFDYGSQITGLEYENPDKLTEGKFLPSTTILNAWKNKQNVEKPKLVVVSVSGGGLRSAMWTVNVLETITDSLNGFSQLHLITGSSGGMIGASYFREEHFINKTTNSKEDRLNTISKDALNSLAYYMAVNDWLVRFRINKNKTKKERGYIFEKQLESNLGGLHHPLSFYKNLEFSANIPLMIYTPTIVSTNEQLVISASKNEFFNNTQFYDGNSIKGIDSVPLSSILRMSSTFPYIMPVVTSPSPQRFNIMDAGLIDNFGIKVMVDYLMENKDWINENTSGVVIVKIVDNEYNTQTTSYSPLKKLMLPMKFFYANFNLQNKNNDRLLFQLSHEISDMNVVEFNLGKSEDPLSLSWHLTQKEKNQIKNAITARSNKEALITLQKLLDTK